MIGVGREGGGTQAFERTGTPVRLPLGEGDGILSCMESNANTASVSESLRNGEVQGSLSVATVGGYGVLGCVSVVVIGGDGEGGRAAALRSDMVE